MAGQEEGVADIVLSGMRRLQFIGTTDDAPRIYWSWSPLPCLASTSLSSGSLNFFAHLHLGVLGLGIHIF